MTARPSSPLSFRRPGRTYQPRPSLLRSPGPGPWRAGVRAVWRNRWRVWPPVLASAALFVRRAVAEIDLAALQAWPAAAWSALSDYGLANHIDRRQGRAALTLPPWPGFGDAQGWALLTLACLAATLAWVRVAERPYDSGWWAWIARREHKRRIALLFRARWDREMARNGVRAQTMTVNRGAGRRA